jgi:hypothetical protein
VERPPHRLLELRWLLDSADLAHRLPSYGVLCRASNLGRQVNPIYLSDYDIYSITHTLFYLTDFGRLPETQLSSVRRRRACEIVGKLLAMQIYRGNWDLVGELLLSHHCLRATSDFYASGWQALLAAQWPDGAVPGPNYRSQATEGMNDTDRQSYVFKHCYHTTLVAALVGALCPMPDW